MLLGTTTPQTDLIDTGDEMIICLHLDDMNDAPIVHVEDFGTVLRVRGQDQARKKGAFSQTIPILCGFENPRASFQGGKLHIRIKKALPTEQTTNPKP